MQHETLSDEDWRRLQKEPCNEYGNSESPCFSAGSSQRSANLPGAFALPGTGSGHSQSLSAVFAERKGRGPQAKSAQLVWLRGMDLNHRPLAYEANELPAAPPRKMSVFMVFRTGIEPAWPP